MADGTRRQAVLTRLRGLPWARIAIVTVLVTAVVALVPPLRNAAATGLSRVVLFVASPWAPDIENFDDLPTTTRILASDGSLLAELDAEKRRPIKLEDLPDHVPQAVLAAEDENFYSHSGIDPKGLFRAIVRNAQGEQQGGSTITQQLAKINYTAGERTFARKFKEVLYASELEKRYSKDELLERYLNQVYFGNNAYGISAAAGNYFGKSASDLTVAEAALLAGKIKSPEGLSVTKDREALKARRDSVIANMAEEGMIDSEEAEQAAAEEIEVNEKPPTEEDDRGMAPHFLEYVKREAKTIDALGGSPESRSEQLFTGGYTIHTTLDPKIFVATVEAVREELGDPEDPVTAVVSVQAGDGAIRNLFGGLDFNATQFDVASLGRRQPGSSYKPFVYLAALRKGIDPRSVMDGRSDREIPCFKEGKTSNYAGEDAPLGLIEIDEALVRSVNTVFAELGCKAGAKNVENAGIDAGLPDDSRESYLGGHEEGYTALQQATAYATLAAGGVYAEPYSIARIEDRDGKVIYEHEPDTERRFSEEEVGVLAKPLQDVVKRGTGRAADIGRPVAGKTGTAQDYRDAWFAGYTPQVATAVWVGYMEPKPMESVNGRAVSGGSFPAAIFASVMRAALEGVEAQRIAVVSPDQLDVTRDDVRPPTTSSSSTSTTSTSTTSSTTSTTVDPDSTTTTSTTARRGTTTTTTAPEDQVESSGDWGSGSSTTTTAPG